MFKKLKSLFVVEEIDPNKPKAAKAKASTPTGKVKSPSPSKPTKSATAPITKPVYDKNNPPKGKVDEKFINRLLGALEENNLEGFDYLEYKQALQNLGNVQMEEGTKFQSALAMATTMGASSEKLISSAEHYIKVLGKEETKFLNAFKSQVSKKETTHNQEIKRLHDGIAERKAQIERLQKEVEAGEKALEKRKSTINNAQTKVESTKSNFYHAYHIVSNQIVEDLAKMKKYLK